MSKQLLLFSSLPAAYKEGDEVNGKRVVRTKHGDLTMVPVSNKTLAEFVSQANEIWHGQYDYSDSVYKTKLDPITIFCPKHDLHFTVGMAQNHLMKHNATGCPVCQYEKQHDRQYGPEWRDTLRLSPKQNRVGKIYQHALSPEQKAARQAEQQRQREEREARRRAESQQRQAAYRQRMAEQKEATRQRKEQERQERKRQREEQERQRIKDFQTMFLREAPKAQGEGYQYRGVENIKGRSSRVMVHCPNPGHEWHEMLVWLCLDGSKCRECAGRHQPVEKRRQKFLDDFHRKHGHNHYIVKGDDYVNNDTPISVHCLIHHHDFKTAPDNLLRGGGGCPYCTASEGEATIKGWLDNHAITHQWHFQMPNLDPTLPLQYIEADFMLPDADGQPRLIIEYHGEQHYEDIPHFFRGKTIRSFAVQQQRDEYLRRYCAERHWPLLEIPYTDFDRIDEILAERLLR